MKDFLQGSWMARMSCAVIFMSLSRPTIILSHDCIALSCNIYSVSRVPIAGLGLVGRCFLVSVWLPYVGILAFCPLAGIARQ
jgi:hypothetical protein